MQDLQQHRLQGVVVQEETFDGKIKSSQIEQGFEKNLLPRSLQIDWQSVRKLSVTPCQWCQGIEDISAMKLDMLPKELDMLPEEEERGKTKTTRGILKSSQLRG